MLNGKISFCQAYDQAQRPLARASCSARRARATSTSSSARPARSRAPSRDKVQMSTLDPRVRALGAEDRVHHRLRDLHPVPDHRPDRELDPDVDGHVHAPTGSRVAAVQAACCSSWSTGGRSSSARSSRASTISTVHRCSHPLAHRMPDSDPIAQGEPTVNEDAVINIAVQSILLATKLAAPILGVSLAIGLVRRAHPVGDADPGADADVRAEARRGRAS